MKETYYFPHDYNARNDVKFAPIRAKHGLLGYGICFALYEMLYENKGSIALAELEDISFSFGIDYKLLQEIIIEFKIFKNDGVNFWSESVNRRLQEREEVRNKYVEAGRKGGIQSGLKRSDAQATLKQNEANEAKERKRKERKVNINTLEPDEASGDVKEILEYFKSMNELSRIVFNAGKKQKILARLKNFSKDDLKKAIENRSKDAFMKGDNQDSKEYRKDFNSLFRSDEQVEKWLNRKSVNPLTLLKNV